MSYSLLHARWRKSGQHPCMTRMTWVLCEAFSLTHCCWWARLHHIVFSKQTTVYWWLVLTGMPTWRPIFVQALRKYLEKTCTHKHSSHTKWVDLSKHVYLTNYQHLAAERRIEKVEILLKREAFYVRLGVDLASETSLCCFRLDSCQMVIWLTTSLRLCCSHRWYCLFL